MFARMGVAVVILCLAGAGLWRLDRKSRDERVDQAAQQEASTGMSDAGLAEPDTGAPVQGEVSDTEDARAQDDIQAAAAQEQTEVNAPYGFKIASITDEGIELYWKKPEGADGYEIYRSYSKDGEFIQVALVTNKSQDTWIDNDFDQEVSAIWYKVRSYQEDEAGKHYSSFTKAKTAKYRRHLVLERSTLYLPSGVSRTVRAFYGWGDAPGVKWSSDNEAVARVSESGEVAAVSAGTCVLCCSSEDLDEEQLCTVTVDREELSSLGEYGQRYVETEPGYWENPSSTSGDSAVLMLTGDMMCTGSQQRKQGADTGDYNFNESFELVRGVIAQSDFAIGNLETVLCSSWPYMVEEAYIDNKANCNAPSRYLDAVKYGGFDAVVMSNNHNCDAGEEGALATEEQVCRYQLAHTGIFPSEDTPRGLIVNINGMKVGFLSYTSTGFNKKEYEWPQEKVDAILNDYKKEKAAADIRELRERGAEYVIVYMHWGVKNVFAVQDSQKEQAQEVADAGADYIVGSHCHLLQPYTTITAADGRSVPCFYSVGDFQSSINQIAGNRDSVILRIRLERDSSGEVVLAEDSYIPCYTRTRYDGKYYVTIPLNESLNGGIQIKHQEKFRDRIAGEVGAELAEYQPEA